MQCVGFRQNSGLKVKKACDLAFVAPALRFETGLLLLTFLPEIGGRALSSDRTLGSPREERTRRFIAQAF